MNFNHIVWIKIMKSIQKSPVRIRVENFFQQLDGRPDESVLRTLFFSLILGLCSFCNADNEPGEKEYFEKERNKFIIEYSADSSLFEMGQEEETLEPVMM